MQITDLDSFENRILETARFFTLSFARPESQGWVDAFWRAEQAYPPPFGATIAHAVLIAIKEVRIARSRGFQFHDPYCARCAKKLTNEERYFMETLRAIRTGQKSRATASALMLCENEDTSGFLSALERLGIITGDVSAPVHI